MLGVQSPWLAKKTTRGILTLLSLVILVEALGVGISFAQDAEFAEPDGPIPRNSYKSWSLFLVCNQAWVLPASKDKLETLFSQFQIFGEAIGPDHLAVWFWKTTPNEDSVRNVDLGRSSAFCTRMNLSSSEGPYVLVTTDYPGKSVLSEYPDSFSQLSNYTVLELGGASADEITNLLNTLGDKLRSEDLRSLAPESKPFWQKFYSVARDTLTGFTRRVTLKVHTGVLTAEYEGGGGE